MTEIESLQQFISNGTCSFTAVRYMEKIFQKNQYTELHETEKWSLEKGKAYYVKRNDSSLIAFSIGSELSENWGFRLAGAHTDSPSFRVKLKSGKKHDGGVTLNAEVYGGPILSTWLDRDISFAGRVTALSDGKLKNIYFDFKRPLTVIPNVAIHLNREVNKGFEYKKQSHLQFLLGTDSDADGFLHILAEEAAVNCEDILEADIYAYILGEVQNTGLNGELLTGPRFDNLAMCDAIQQALLGNLSDSHISVGIFYDNEEVGSETLQGADSSFLHELLERIVLNLGEVREDFFRRKSLSFLISADGAHAVHPSYPEKHDKVYAPKLNGGPAIKINGNYRYATTSKAAAFFKALCKEADIPVQTFIIESDIACGSTIGPISSSALGIATLDVGSPMLAMHSARETIGVKDHTYMVNALKAFFQGKGEYDF